MIRYRPITRLPIGGITLGEMEACQQGNWVQYFQYADLLSDLITALSWIEGGGDNDDYEQGIVEIINPFKAKYDL